MNVLSTLKSFFNKNEEENKNQKLLKLLEKLEQDIFKKKNIANTLFLSAVRSHLNINELYTKFPEFIEEHLISQNTSILEKEILEKFKNNILNIKLFIYKNIEDNPIDFYFFKQKLEKNHPNFNNLDDEEQTKLLSLSFYLYSKGRNKNIDYLQYKDIINSIKEAKKLIYYDFFETILPKSEELNILLKNDINFKSGLEYEFFVKPELFKNKKSTQEGEIVISKFNDILDNLNLTKNRNKIEDEDNDNSGKKRQYLEIISKKFDSLSEMLIFHDLMLNIIKNINIKKKEEILINQKDMQKEKEHQENNFKTIPGSIHLNISVPNVENINKVKFFLFLKDSGIINDWKERSDSVKNLSTMVDVFGPFVVETDLIDKFWSVNFDYLTKPDKTGNVNSRLEIRFMGGIDYTDRKDDINKNISIILDCVKQGMDNNLNIEKYQELLSKYQEKDFENLKPNEQELLEKVFKTNDINKIYKMYIETQEKINKIKKQYYLKM